MGLFSFLGGGKKKEKVATVKAEAPPLAPTGAEKRAEAALAKAASAPPPPQVVATPTGVTQARLRLKLMASLRSGEHALAYEAAKGLADIQAKAGRRVGARVWSAEAERIRSGIAA